MGEPPRRRRDPHGIFTNCCPGGHLALAWHDPHKIAPARGAGACVVLKRKLRHAAFSPHNAMAWSRNARAEARAEHSSSASASGRPACPTGNQIGRASCRERECPYVSISLVTV